MSIKTALEKKFGVKGRNIEDVIEKKFGVKGKSIEDAIAKNEIDGGGSEALIPKQYVTCQYDNTNTKVLSQIFTTAEFELGKRYQFDVGWKAHLNGRGQDAGGVAADYSFEVICADGSTVPYSEWSGEYLYNAPKYTFTGNDNFHCYFTTYWAESYYADKIGPNLLIFRTLNETNPPGISTDCVLYIEVKELA